MNLLRRDTADQKLDWLASQPWWADLRPGDLQVLASTGDRTSVPAGRMLMTEGSRGLESVVVVAGEVEVVNDGRVVATLGPGDVVGELSLLDGIPRTADVRTSTDVELLVFSTQGLRSALTGSSALREQVQRAAAEHRR
jgi:CRP-like cAMP-binding protein